jgi:hypothetical protein
MAGLRVKKAPHSNQVTPHQRKRTDTIHHQPTPRQGIDVAVGHVYDCSSKLINLSSAVHYLCPSSQTAHHTPRLLIGASSKASCADLTTTASTAIRRPTCVEGYVSSFRLQGVDGSLTTTASVCTTSRENRDAPITKNVDSSEDDDTCLSKTSHTTRLDRGTQLTAPLWAQQCRTTQGLQGRKRSSKRISGHPKQLLHRRDVNTSTQRDIPGSTSEQAACNTQKSEPRGGDFMRS